MTDRRTILVVVVARAVLTAIALVGTILLLVLDKPAESVALIAATTGAGMGALSAILVSTRSTDPAPEPGTTVQTVASTTVTATDAAKP